MTLTPGARLGPYEILAAIGAGGPAPAFATVTSYRTGRRDSSRSALW